ncbi:MAG TPA: tetratricopeptide repeat protein [Puia sp.]|jgi:signal transduction histidine kinase|nr:tetratricopeptide repeat protein [Puia sp.]
MLPLPKWIACFLLLALSLPSRAQLSKPDSLAGVIDRYPANDTTKTNLMVLLAKMLAYSDPSRGMKVIDAEIPIARQLHYKKGILESYNVKSSLYFLQGNLMQAETVGEEYLQTATRFNDKPNLIVANSLLGILSSQSGNYAKALEYMLSSLKLAEEVGDKNKLAALDQNLGNVYNDMEDYDKAFDYYKQAIATIESIVPRMPVPPSPYNNIGSVLIHQKRYKEALEYLETGSRISQQTNNRRSLAGAYTNLSDAWHNLGDNDKSYEFGTRALDISRALSDKRSMANAMINAGTALSDVSDNVLRARHIDPKDRYPMAVGLLDSAIQLAAAIGDPVTREEAYKYLGEISRREKDYPLALSSMEAYEELHDTIINNDNEKTIIRKFIQYDYDKKAAEIQLRQQITEGKLKEQELLSRDAEQQLKLNQNELALANKDRDLERLTAKQEQAELAREQQEKKNIQTLADQKDRINALEIASQRRLKYGLIAGLLLIAAIGVLLYRQGMIRKKANQKLTRANAQLDEANRVKARFFGIISHDLRGPVANLISLIDLRREAPDLLDEDRMNVGRQKITDTAGNLLHVMEDILLWSKGQMVAFKPQMKTLFVDQVFSELRLLYPDNGRLRIIFCDPRQLQLETDEDYLKTILRNLTSNAIKAVHGRTDGMIEWRAWKEDHHVCLAVTDNGPGIPTSQRQALFNDEGDIGTRHGLGLPLIRDLTTAIHCEIQIDTPSGGGTTFTLLFPVFQAVSLS